MGMKNMYTNRIVLILTLLVCLALTGCECKHALAETNRVAPGCMSDGIASFTCTKCGESYDEAIPATGHSVEKGLCEYCGLVVTEYGTLGQNEALVLNKLIEVSLEFKNPASIKLLDVLAIGNDNDSCTVIISAENSFGATSKEICWISSEGKVLDVSFLGADSFVEDGIEYDVASINEAMQNYYKSMGWMD